MVQPEGNTPLKNPVTPPGINPRTVQLVAQRLNYYATPGHLNLCARSISATNTAKTNADIIKYSISL